MENDWKMLTIFIGANDLCLGYMENDNNFIDHNNYNYVSFSCSGKVPTLTANDYEKHLREILEEVRKKIPRVFVNVVQVFNLSMVWLLTKTSCVVYLTTDMLLLAMPYMMIMYIILYSACWTL